MRKIIFRAKKTTDKEWVLGGYVQSIQTDKKTGFNRDTHFIMENNGLANEVEPETVCQYTGLIDKNGRKIFEGDIVRYTDEAIGKEKVDEVKYNETHAAFCRLHKSEMGLQYLFIDEAIANRCEVCGNIFDNPDLIGE